MPNVFNEGSQDDRSGIPCNVWLCDANGTALIITGVRACYRRNDKRRSDTVIHLVVTYIKTNRLTANMLSKLARTAVERRSSESSAVGIAVDLTRLFAHISVDRIEEQDRKGKAGGLDQ